VAGSVLLGVFGAAVHGWPLAAIVLTIAAWHVVYRWSPGGTPVAELSPAGGD
jgi:hypothetical protein